MRKRIYEIINVSNGNDKLSMAYDCIMMFLIIISLIPLAFKTFHFPFGVLGKICAAAFILDYILRWLTADFKYGKKSVSSFIRYPFSFMAIVDLLSTLTLLTSLNNSLRVLRVLRLTQVLRIARLFKAFRYMRSIRIVSNVLKKSKEALIAVFSFAFLYIMVAALVIYNVEPDTFPSFFDAVYWAVVSLTTVGYGDIYPVTTAGKVITMISAIFGVAVVALPSGIITAGYMSELSANKLEQEEDQTRNDESGDKIAR